jgi:hypothetical protein
MESLSPFLQGSCIPYNMPVYPGAQRVIAWPMLQAYFSDNVLSDSGVTAAWAGWLNGAIRVRQGRWIA